MMLRKKRKNRQSNSTGFFSDACHTFLNKIANLVSDLKIGAHDVLKRIAAPKGKRRRLTKKAKLFLGVFFGVIAVLAIVVIIAVLASPYHYDAPDVTVLSSTLLENSSEDNNNQSSSAVGAFNTADQSQSMPTPSPVVPAPTPEPDPMVTFISRGDTASSVPKIQERLMELGYMDPDEPTNYYGSITENAIELFQRKHELVIDGCVGKETYVLLMSDQAKKYTVSLGDQGSDVKDLQVRLRELGYINKATEYFGTETEAAVIKFQTLNGLTADGSVGELTREMLYSADAKANYMSRGEVSDEVLKYQKLLQKLGYLTTTPDGTYGSDTEMAVKRFQERNGLIGDGYLGPQTKALLSSSKAQANALMLGMSGSDVENVQQRLKELNYLKKVTGYYGSDTENAVRNFQDRNGLTVDGKVGKQTMSMLNSSKAKKAASVSSGSSSGSSSGVSPSGSSNSSSSNSSSSSSSSSASSLPQVSVGANVENFIAIAKSKLGCKYVKAGKGPNVFDCSGFVYWCLNQAGVKQSYMTSASWQKTTKYQRISSMSDLQRGDVISYKGHVGIYLGNGQMIDASSTEGKIRICNNIQSSSYWKKHFVCGYRIF